MSLARGARRTVADAAADDTGDAAHMIYENCDGAGDGAPALAGDGGAAFADAGGGVLSPTT